MEYEERDRKDGIEEGGWDMKDGTEEGGRDRKDGIEEVGLDRKDDIEEGGRYRGEGGGRDRVGRKISVRGQQDS